MTKELFTAPLCDSVCVYQLTVRMLRDIIKRHKRRVKIG